MKDKLKALDILHAKIHGMRMIPNFKPDKFTLDANIVLAEAYQDECMECKNKLESFKLKERLRQIEPPREKEKSKFDIGGLFR